MADATCPFVTQQGEAEIELLKPAVIWWSSAVARITASPAFRGSRKKKAKKSLSSSAKKKSIRSDLLVSSPSA